MNVEVYDPRMTDLVLGNASLQKVHGGMLWAEGPVYFPAGDYFLWSDIPNNRLYQWPSGSAVAGSARYTKQPSCSGVARVPS